MRKIILSLVLVFGILFGVDVFAQYEIIDSKYLEGNSEFYKNIKFNPNIISRKKLNIELEKYGIDKNKCKLSSSYYNKGGISIITCGNQNINKVYPDWNIYINGIKVNPGYSFNGPGITNIEFIGDTLRIDHIISYTVSAGHIYLLKDIPTKEELLKKVSKAKSSMGIKYSKIIKKIDLVISRLDNEKLNSLKLKVLDLKNKYKNNPNIIKILNYIENLIKIKIGDYRYEYSFHQDNFKLNIKNDENNNKVLFGNVSDKNVGKIEISNIGEVKNINGGKWEFNTNKKFNGDNLYIYYYDKNGKIYYSESIYSGKNINNNDFKLNIKNDKNYNKVLFGEVLDKNVKSIKIENKIVVKDFKRGRWEQNTKLKYGKQSYNVDYYDENGDWYFHQEIYID